MLILNENKSGLKMTIMEEVINILVDSENQARYLNFNSCRANKLRFNPITPINTTIIKS